MAATSSGSTPVGAALRRASRSASTSDLLERFKPPGPTVPLRFVRTISIDRGHKVSCGDKYNASDVMRSAVAHGTFEKRQGSGYRRWQRRHFALLPMTMLMYYLNPSDTEAYGCVLVGPHATARVVENDKEKKFELHLCPFPSAGNDKIVTLGFPNRTDAEHWRDAILNCRYEHLQSYVHSMQRNQERLHGFYTSIEGLAHSRKERLDEINEEKDAALQECERLRDELRRRDAATAELQRQVGACLKAERLLRQSLARSLDHKEVQRVESEWKTSREPGWKRDRARLRQAMAGAPAPPSPDQPAVQSQSPPQSSGSSALRTAPSAGASPAVGSSGSSLTSYASLDIDCRTLPPAWRVDGADELLASHLQGAPSELELDSPDKPNSRGDYGAFVDGYTTQHTVLDEPALGEAVAALAARLDFGSALSKQNRDSFAKMVQATLTVKEKYNQVLNSLLSERRRSRSRSHSRGDGRNRSRSFTRHPGGSLQASGQQRRSTMASPLASRRYGSIPRMSPLKDGAADAAGIGRSQSVADVVGLDLHDDRAHHGAGEAGATAGLYAVGARASTGSFSTGSSTTGGVTVPGRGRTESFASVGSSIGVRDAEVFSDTESESGSDGGKESQHGEVEQPTYESGATGTGAGDGDAEDDIFKRERDAVVARTASTATPRAAAPAPPASSAATAARPSAIVATAPTPPRPLIPVDPHPCRLWVLAMTARHLPRSEFRTMTGGMCRAWLKIRAFGHLTEGQKVSTAALDANKGIAAVFKGPVQRTRGVVPAASGAGEPETDLDKPSASGLQMFWLRVTDHLDIAGSIVHVDVMREGMRLFGTDAHVGTSAIDVSCLEAWPNQPHAVWCELHKPLRWDVDKKKAALNAAMAAARAAESGRKSAGPLRDDNGDPLPSRRERLLPVGGPAANKPIPSIGLVQRSASSMLEEEEADGKGDDADGEGVGLGDSGPRVILRREDSRQDRFAASELPPPPLDTRPKILLQFVYTTAPGALPRFFDPARAKRQASSQQGAAMGVSPTGADQRERGFSVTSLPPPTMDEKTLQAAATMEGSGAAAEASKIAGDAQLDLSRLQPRHLDPGSASSSSLSLVPGGYERDHAGYPVTGAGAEMPTGAAVAAATQAAAAAETEQSADGKSNTKDTKVAGELSERDKLQVLRREYKKLYKRHRKLRKKAVLMRDKLVQVAARRHMAGHHKKHADSSQESAPPGMAGAGGEQDGGIRLETAADSPTSPGRTE